VDPHKVTMTFMDVKQERPRHSLYHKLQGCFSFVSTTVLTTAWDFIISHFATKAATVFINSNKQETVITNYKIKRLESTMESLGRYSRLGSAGSELGSEKQEAEEAQEQQ
jgi:hypothetical protein